MPSTACNVIPCVGGKCGIAPQALQAGGEGVSSVGVCGPGIDVCNVPHLDVRQHFDVSLSGMLLRGGDGPCCRPSGAPPP